MTSGGTLPRGATGTRTQAVAGVVVVAHGGQSSSTDATNPLQPAMLRIIPVAAAVRHALRGSGAVVLRPRFRLRGWNGAQASPVGDLNETLDGIAAAYGAVPVVLIGHSMGARAAIRAAGHPAVSAVAGLAPWLPLGEPAAQLAGRRVLLAHGTADTITSPAETWAFVKRAREFTTVTAIEVRDGDHPMLRRARLWHAIAAEFARSAVGLTADPADPADSVDPADPADPAHSAGQADPAGAEGDVAAAVTVAAGRQPRVLL
jgi:alpha-beta hydrolase superfamily lysophospholipase